MPGVLFAVSECYPWVKTGGLGDVAEVLSAALHRAGLDVRLLIPGYREVRRHMREGRIVGRVPALGAMPETQIVESRLPTGVPVLVVDAPQLYDRDGGPYLDSERRDWPDNAVRFGLLAHAASSIALGSLHQYWQPDLVHLHDWQTALAAAYIRAADDPDAPPVVFTIHNLAFQGIFPRANLEALGLPPELFSVDGIEYHDHISFMKAGVVYANAITTVSPSYAREIVRPPLGFGLEGLLSRRAGVLHGILNGIDTAEWNTTSDPHIAARYDTMTLGAKAANKTALQARMGLRVDSAVPLLGFVGRLTQQKGMDLIIEAVPKLVDLPVQLALLGTGEYTYENELRRLAGRHPQTLAFSVDFEEPLAHLIEAGADAFLMPSQFEPCGLNQMYSQRYGTPPIARATGGLRDTIVDCNDITLAGNTATGFLFTEATAEALVATVQRAVAVYNSPQAWRRLQRNGMVRDFSWAASVRRYLALYQSLITEPLLEKRA